MTAFYSKKFQRLVFWLLALSTVGVTIYSLLPAEFFRVHDFTQGARVVEMFRGFQEGQIPVRWSKNFGFGYGMPTFLFYGPFPYVIGSLIYWLTQNIVFSLKILWALPSIASFIGMYAFMKKYLGTWGALLSAISFTLAPYRAVDLYVRGAIGEAWGIALFPWLLIAVDHWFERPRWIDPSLSIVTGILLITHNLMAMFFLPVVLCYGILKWLLAKQRTLLQAVQFCVQLLVGLGLSAFFVIPALAEKDQTQIQQRILSGYFSYTQHFVYIRQFFKENWKYGGSVWGPSDDLSFFLGYGQLLALFVLVLLTLFWFLSRVKNGKNLQHLVQILFVRYSQTAPIAILSLLFFPVSLFFCIGKSSFIWDLSTLLQTAQFPWRFLSLSIFFLAILNGFVLRFPIPKWLKTFTFFVIVLALFIPSVKYFHPEKFLEHSSTFYYTDEHRIRFEMSGTWPDFVPLHFNNKLLPTDQRFQVPIDAENSRVSVLADRSSELLLQTAFQDQTNLTINISNFPGWSVYLNGQKTAFTETKDGLIQLVVPPGQQLISVVLERSMVRSLADIMSAVSLVIISSPFIILKKKFV